MNEMSLNGPRPCHHDKISQIIGISMKRFIRPHLAFSLYFLLTHSHENSLSLSSVLETGENRERENAGKWKTFLQKKKKIIRK